MGMKWQFMTSKETEYKFLIERLMLWRDFSEDYYLEVWQ